LSVATIISFAAEHLNFGVAGYAFTGAASGDATVHISLNCGVNDVPAFTTVANQADSVAATVGALVTDFNALLAKLKAAGIMVAD